MVINIAYYVISCNTCFIVISISYYLLSFKQMFYGKYTAFYLTVHFTMTIIVIL